MVLFYFRVILVEITIKCEIGFVKFVKILEDQWKWEKGTIIFNIQQNTIVCTPSFLNKKPMGFLGLVFEFFKKIIWCK
jgi:hypothetical protein